MTNELEAEAVLEESLKFAEIRSIFQPSNIANHNEIKKKSKHEISDVESATKIFNLASNQSSSRLPPPLLPKPNLAEIESRLTATERVISHNENLKTDELLQKNSSNIDIKKTIERLDKFGTKLFEPKYFNVKLFNQKTSSSLSTSPICKNDEKDESENVVASFSNSDTETEADSSIQTLSPDLGFSETLVRQSSDLHDYDRNESTCDNNGTLHTSILREMRSKGLFKKLSSIGANYLQEDIGKMRNSSCKINRQPCISEPSNACEADLSSNNQANSEESQFYKQNVYLRESTASTNQSVTSTRTTSTLSDCLDRDSFALNSTGDKKEDKGLRNLHSIAREFYFVQKTYVELLNHISENYLKFLNECSTRFGKPLLSNTYNGTPHVIIRISVNLKQILGVHKILLDDFAEKYSKWDSQNPDLASVLQQKAEFLKICNPFLKEKRSLSTELQQALDENKDLAYATKQFEDNVLNSSTNECGENGSVMSLRGISIVMHLDAVHQNVVRYRLLMERYRKFLPDDSPEANVAEEALRKLTVVSNTVNGYLANAEADTKLLQLHRKLEGVFDVFAPGRSLIHEGELQRQTRKDLQLRYLILFSDTLLICRYSSLGSESFDPSSLYKISIERVRVQIEEHEDYEREFVVISPKKSSAFVAKSKLERDIWVKRINEARQDFRDKTNKRRSYAMQQQTNLTLSHNSCDESPDVESRSIFDNDSTKVSQQKNGGFVKPPTSKTNRNERGSLMSNRYEALWIPDNKATKCLMTGCDTKFNILKRKHHCRQCGWLICGNCVGYAPVKIKNFERVKVCPECYYDICRAFESGHLFPVSRIQRFNSTFTTAASNFFTFATSNSTLVDIAEVAIPGNEVTNNNTESPEVKKLDETNCTSETIANFQVFSLEDTSLRIVYGGGLKYEIPKDLFIPPPNGFLVKAKIPVQQSGELFLVSGKVIMKNKKGVDVLRWARLTKDMTLQFYEAEFDDQPLQSYFVYGYSLKTTDIDDGSRIIELSHRNQFETDRKEDRIIFQVNHSRSAEKWIDSLRNCINTYSEEC